jgi:hypothetical protein
MKLNEELSRVYYTAAEARKVLGLDEEAFQYWGRTERFRRILLKGRKQAVYSKREINKMANQINAAILAEKATGLEYRKATLDDIDSEVELAQFVFGARAGMVEAVKLRRAFREKNLDTTYHLYDGDYLAAYINIFPFGNEAIESFKHGTKGWLLDIDQMEQFTPDKPHACIIIDLATTPSTTPARRGTYAQILLEGFYETLKNWGEQGIEITRVYAASNTPQGIRILKHAGFETIQEVSTGRYTFELDIANAGGKLLAEYKNALQESQANKTMN